MDENYQSPITPKILDISWGTIIKTIAALGGLYFLYLIRDMLIWFIFALVISILFNPAINFLRKLKVPRVMGTILIYLALFVLIGGFIYMVSFSLVQELVKFSSNLHLYFDEIAEFLKPLGLVAMDNLDSFVAMAGQSLGGASKGILAAIGTLFGGIMSAIAIFAIAFFLSLEEEGVAKAIVLATPRKFKTKALEIWKRTQKKISSWFGVRIICSLFIGSVTTISCYALNIDYGVAFGLMAGLANFIPTIGPFFAGLVIFMFITTSATVAKAIIFVIAYYLAQLIENYVFMPVLSKKLLRLSPTLVLVSLMVGAKLWGILGAILAIPLVGMFAEFIRGFLEKKNE